MSGAYAYAYAAAIVNRLWEAGLTSGPIAWWHRTPRPELGGRTPRQAMHTDGRRVLELAEADARQLRAERELLCRP